MYWLMNSLLNAQKTDAYNFCIVTIFDKSGRKFISHIFVDFRHFSKVVEKFDLPLFGEGKLLKSIFNSYKPHLIILTEKISFSFKKYLADCIPRSLVA